MFFVGDFHLHSKYSRATSKDMNLENMWKWAQLKGIKLLSAADFTHPLWFAELCEKLEPAEPGLYKLKKPLYEKIAAEVPSSCRAETRFILTTEISCIYSKKSRTRKVHNILFAPSLEIAQKINHRLGAIGNLRADGRPILGLDSKTLLKILLDISRDCLLVPAHAWTPHFSVFGSNSGFDSLEECFEELTPYIIAIETGLSSDPEMNWRLSSLDAITLISNSDAHSLPKMGRECNVFDTEFSYDGIVTAFKKDDSREGKKHEPRAMGLVGSHCEHISAQSQVGRRPIDCARQLVMTIEFFPEEGKYHFDGHRNCGVRLKPEESIRGNNICSNCGKPVTIGVLHRVEALADRPEGFKLRNAPPFKKLIPLHEIIGEALGMGNQTAGVQSEYWRLLNNFGNELKILMKVPHDDLKKFSHPLVAEGISRVREEKLEISAGYDGEYGTIHIFSEGERMNVKQKQETLF